MNETLKLLLPIVVAHVCVLIVIVVVIRRMLLSDTMQAVAQVRQVEAEIRKKEESIRRDIEEQQKDLARQKTAAEEELQRRKEEADKELAKLRDKVTEEARTEGDRIIEQARRNEAKLRAQISQQMEEKAVDYGTQIFQLVFSDAMSEEMDRKFTDELLDALAEVDAAGITLDSSEAEFTVSHPLAEEQRKRLEQILHEKFGVQVKVEEKVDEALIGGVSFKLGSLEIDGSLRNRFEEAAAEVKKTAKA